MSERQAKRLRRAMRQFMRQRGIPRSAAETGAGHVAAIWPGLNHRERGKVGARMAALDLRAAVRSAYAR